MYVCPFLSLVMASILACRQMWGILTTGLLDVVVSLSGVVGLGVHVRGVGLFGFFHGFVGFGVAGLVGFGVFLGVPVLYKIIISTMK